MGHYTKLHYGKPSYALTNDSVDIRVSVQSGMFTASYTSGGKSIDPYFISPWWNEAPFLDQDPIMQNLRGDYFCFPFGADVSPYPGVSYQIHGRTANNCWDFVAIEEAGGAKTVQLRMDLTPEDGHVDKVLTIRNGQPIVYTKHIVSGFSGQAPLGNHPNIQCSEVSGTAIIDMTPPLIGFTAPMPIDVPENMAYSLLKPGIEFSDMTAVPTVYGDTVDMTRYPLPRGYEDVAMMISDPDRDFCFSSITEPAKGFLYFHLKDPKVLAETLLWMPNSGRYSPPMNGRVLGNIGLEEVTGNFFYGRAESLKSNAISEKGYKTYLEFSDQHPTSAKLISGTIPIESSFAGVKDIVQKNSNEITILGKGGERIDVPCSLDFMNS
ncbi:MAG: hypothetical protein GY798_23150 [Hyphomicrobiales bacterium]|nr:hypothetical protein [Hyphomicrobiales bacterium]